MFDDRRSLCSMFAAVALICACSDSDEETVASTAGGGGETSGVGGGAAATGGGGAGGADPCAPSLPVDEEIPELLSETGLYADIASEQLPPYVQSFEPAYELWSDDAEKRRWIYLPECGQIDTSDMDNWSLPVGCGRRCRRTIQPTYSRIRVWETTRIHGFVGTATPLSRWRHARCRAVA